MKHTFVIDENVAIAAATLARPDGERDLTSALLLNRMIANCHRLAWSRLIYARWSRTSQAMRSRHQLVSVSFSSLLAQAMVVTGKCPLPDDGDPPALAEESGWTTKVEDDRDFIRLAAHFGVCFLVTYDGPLRRDIQALGLDIAYGFQVLTPDEALPLASQPSDDL